MKTFVIGDIHGGLKAIQQVLALGNVQPTDLLIFLGDYVDGWSDSANVLDFLIDISQKQKCIFIKGNHDDLLLNYLKNNETPSEWLVHGGQLTVDIYKNIPTKTKEKHLAFLENLQNYYLDSHHRLFIHAGFTSLKGVTFEYFKPMFYWDRTLWELAVSINKNLLKTAPNYPNRLKIYHEIYIGHTPVTRIGASVPVHKNTVWNMDTGAGFLGKLSMLNVETKTYFQSDELPKLYPNETGRNNISF